jgi:hypothetical protein
MQKVAKKYLDKGWQLNEKQKNIGCCSIGHLLDDLKARIKGWVPWFWNLLGTTLGLQKV